MNRSLIGIVVMVAGLGIATCAALVKTKQEIEKRPTDAWGSNLREKLLTRMASDNPGHKVLNPRALDLGIEEYLPTPVKVEETTLRFSWYSGNTNIELDRRGDGSDPFIDRALLSWKYAASLVPPEGK